MGRFDAKTLPFDAKIDGIKTSFNGLNYEKNRPSSYIKSVC
jgi:hypothetical protein